MQLTIKIALLIAIIAAPVAEARIASDKLPSSARFGLDLYHMTQATYDREDRFAYSFAYNWAILPYLRLDNYFVYAPDGSAATDVKFTEDLYILSPMLSFAYPALFRFVGSIGPAYIMTKSHVSFRGDSKSTQLSQIGSKLAFNTEYVIADCCEVVASVGVVLRHQDTKMDWSYGIAYSQNIGPVSAPAAPLTKPKTLKGTR